MTKIKKSIWSVVVGVVMSLALVFGVFAGVNTNKVAKADNNSPEGALFIAIVYRYFPSSSVNNTSMLLDETKLPLYTNEDGTPKEGTPVYTKLEAYTEAYRLYNATDGEGNYLIPEEERAEGDDVDYYFQRLEKIRKNIVQPCLDSIEAINGINEGQLGYMVARQGHYYDCVGTHQVRYYDRWLDPKFGTDEADPLADEFGYLYGYVLEDNTTNGVIYDDTTAYVTINAAFEALDENQQEYVRRNTNRAKNLHIVGSALAVANEMISYVKTESINLQKLIVGEYVEGQFVPGTGVLYSYKADFDALVETYNYLDPTAQEETSVATAYGEVSGLGGQNGAFAYIESKALAAQTAIKDMEYWSPTSKTMVKVDLGTPLGENEVVVDTQETFDAATLALNTIYDGEKVNEFYIASYATFADVPQTERNALATYFTDLAKYDAAEVALAGYKADAAEVEEDIEDEDFVVTDTNHYKVLEDEINEVYGEYDALDGKSYYDAQNVGHHNKQKYIAEENRAKIEYYNNTLVTLNAWIKDVAVLVDAKNELGQLALTQNSTVADVDAVIAWAYGKLTAQPKEDFGFDVNDKTTVENLLTAYEALIKVDDEVETARVNSLHDAHEVLVYLKGKIDEALKEKENIETAIENLESVLTNGVKYADRKTYDELTARVAELERVYPNLQLDKQNLEYLGEALDEIATRAMNLGEYIESILYRYVFDEEYAMGTYEEAGDERQVVAASRDTIEAAQAAVAEVYNGDEFYTEDDEPVFKFKIAELAYVLGENWAEDVVTYTNDEEEEVTKNAFVYYFGEFVEVEEYFERYDAAVTALNALKKLAADLQKDIEEQLIDVISEENHYRTLRTTIVALYERYQALADYDEEENEVRGEFDNLQPWVTGVILDNDEPLEIDGGKVIEYAYETLVALEGWREAVAVAIDGYNDPAQLSEVPTLEEVDALISGTEAEDVQLTLTQVNALLANYATVTGQDPIKKAAVADAYALLHGRQEQINNDKTTLLQNISNLSAENVTYKAKPTYDTLKAEYDRLVALGVEFTPDDVANLTAVGTALTAIEIRTTALKTAIDNILYYVEPEELDEEAEEDTCMVKDPTGAVVYDTRTSLLAAKEAIEAVYPSNGQDNVAKLGAKWYEDETEVEAFLAEYAELAGITADDVDQYVTVLTDYLALENAAKAVAQRIHDLTLTEENNFKAQEAVINKLLEDFEALVHEEVLHNHNNWFVNPILVDTIHHDATDYEEEYDEPVYNYVYALDLAGNIIFPDAYTQKLTYVYLALCAVNQFDCEVANLVTGEEVADPENPLTKELIAAIDAVLVEYAEVDLTEVYTYDVKAIYDLLNQYDLVVESFDEEVDPEYNIFPEVNPAEYKDAYVAAVKPAKDVLDKYYEAARKLNNKLVRIIVDICEKNDPDIEDKTLSEADEEKINYVKEVYEQFTWSQKAILENDCENHYEPFYDEEGEECGGYYWNEETLDYFYEDGWNNISPRTMEEFFSIAHRFEGANYYKQAVEELVTQLGETYFTVEGYVLEKGLLAMYFTFDDEMKAMVDSAYHKLLNIDAAYKLQERENYTSYTTVTNDLEGQLDDAKTELAEAQEALETEIKEALGEADAETVKEALEAYKEAVEQAQADLEAAKDALVAEITNSLDPEAESVEAAFETYKEAVAQAQADLEAAQEELVTEIKTALGDEEAESVQAALENYKASVEETQAEQAQTQAEAAKAAEDGNKENDEKVAKLKKALIITAVVGGVVAVAAVACIVVLFAKMAALGGAAAGSAAAGSSAAGGAAGAEGGKEE